MKRGRSYIDSAEWLKNNKATINPKSNDENCFQYTLKYNHGEKSMRAPFVIYAELQCLLEKMHSCQNNLEKSYTEKKIKHTPSRYSLFTN